MKVKKYVGETIQDTIFKVKAELGPDAIILNTRKYKKGGFMGMFGRKRVEVIAALENKDKTDEKTLQEIAEIKNMVSSLNKQWQSQSFVDNLPDELSLLYSHLAKEGINGDFLKNYITDLNKKDIEDLSKIIGITKQRFRKIIGNCQPINTGGERKVAIFVGPTGVGKTTTIAKLAAKFSLEKNKKVALITSDTYRIAAVQQLQTYSDIINIPLEVVYNEKELVQTLNTKFKSYDLVLVDTAGSSWNNKLQLGRLKKIACNDLVDETHLLISFNMKSNDLKNVINKFSQLKPDKFLVTKLDETTLFGDIINVRQEYDLPYSYITFGQDVPDDIDTAKPENLVKYLMGDLYE